MIFTCHGESSRWWHHWCRIMQRGVADITCTNVSFLICILMVINAMYVLVYRTMVQTLMWIELLIYIFVYLSIYLWLIWRRCQQISLLASNYVSIYEKETGKEMAGRDSSTISFTICSLVRMTRGKLRSTPLRYLTYGPRFESGLLACKVKVLPTRQ